MNKSKLTPQAAVDAWNSRVKINDLVTYLDDLGEAHSTRTRSEASVLSGHTAVIWVDGIAGCVALSRVTPA
jgi:hypothetical protein